MTSPYVGQFWTPTPMSLNVTKSSNPLPSCILHSDIVASSKMAFHLLCIHINCPICQYYHTSCAFVIGMKKSILKLNYLMTNIFSSYGPSGWEVVTVPPFL